MLICPFNQNPYKTSSSLIYAPNPLLLSIAYNLLATITKATTNSTTTILISKNHNTFSFHKSSQFCLRPTMRECNAFPAESRGFPSNLISDLIYVRNATVASELHAFALKQLFVLYYCFIQFHRSLFTFHLKQLFAICPFPMLNPMLDRKYTQDMKRAFN